LKINSSILEGFLFYMICRVVQQKDSNAHPASLSYNVGRTFKLKAQTLATALAILSAKKNDFTEYV